MKNEADGPEVDRKVSALTTRLVMVANFGYRLATATFAGQVGSPCPARILSAKDRVN